RAAPGTSWRLRSRCPGHRSASASPAQTRSRCCRGDRARTDATAPLLVLPRSDDTCAWRSTAPQALEREPPCALIATARASRYLLGDLRKLPGGGRTGRRVHDHASGICRGAERGRIEGNAGGRLQVERLG